MFSSLLLTSTLLISAAGHLPPYFCRRLCVRVLIAKNVLHFYIEFVGSLIDELEIASFDLRPRAFAQVLCEYGFDKSGTRLLRPGNAIDPGEHLFRQCDRSLLFHTTIILPEMTVARPLAPGACSANILVRSGGSAASMRTGVSALHEGPAQYVVEVRRRIPATTIRCSSTWRS